MNLTLATAVTLAVLAAALAAGEQPATPRIDDSPAKEGEWGFRPLAESESPVTPPAFCWRPQAGAKSYQLQVSMAADFATLVYEKGELPLFCHCPPRPFPSGAYHWRFRFIAADGSPSAWSRVRRFTIPEGATELPLPPREELLARVPSQHPRLFIRPEDLPRLRGLAQGELKEQYENLVATCEKLLKNPPPTAEPPKYDADMKRGSDPWRKVWWGNRTYTINALNGAATLAFTRLLGGRDEYGQLARKILLACAEWDPKGATGYRYNDEAGMPYAYYFSRTYTFVYDLLSDADRAKCRQVMAIRGDELYRHLYPRHLWTPYASHSNRAWHFLGEVGLAFHGELPAAEDWLWFAVNVFFTSYPVWSDDDGGWHEGTSYWNSYVTRFLWWADIMRAALRIDAYKKPYFSKIGYYPLYLMPPGTKGGGFGDLTASRTSAKNASLVAICAAQAQNPYWQWYVNAHGPTPKQSGYVGFIRGALPSVEAKPPTDLPSSRCFRGIGQAYLNTTLLEAKDNVEVIFKSSPFGSQSHGYEAQNAFLLYAFGERLLIRTGRRDSYGSDHHRNWMWETKSVNSVTVNGKGQRPHSNTARGEITSFHTDEHLDVVTGEAAAAYEGRLKRFTRTILFVKPELVIVFDQLEAPSPSTFEWRLHAPTELTLTGGQQAYVENGKAACTVQFLQPAPLDLSVTDKFDTPPRERIKLTEWHLTAATPKRQRACQFVTLLRPHRADSHPPTDATLTRLPAGYQLEATLTTGAVTALLRTAPGDLTTKTLHCPNALAMRIADAHGNTVAEYMGE